MMHAWFIGDAAWHQWPQALQPVLWQNPAMHWGMPLVLLFVFGCATGDAAGGPDAPPQDATARDAAVDAAPDAAIDAAIDAPIDAAADATAPDGAHGDGGPCDPTQPQGADGCDSPVPKCSVTFPNPSGPGVLACEPAGTVLTGGSCMRALDSSGNELIGVDNCLDGYCSALGVATGRQCRRYCSRTESTCALGQPCFEQLSPYGLCRTPCDPFGAASQCPQSNSLAPVQACSWAVLVGETTSGAFCSTIGATVALGGACNPSANPPLDCVQGTICLGDGTCHLLCDTSGNHNCPGGQICNPATYATANTCSASGAGCPTPEQCDTASGTCFVVAPGPSGGGWCIAAPDAGGPVILRLHELPAASVARSAAPRPR
jgi:hypothetical protein